MCYVVRCDRTLWFRQNSRSLTKLVLPPRCARSLVASQWRRPCQPFNCLNVHATELPPTSGLEVAVTKKSVVQSSKVMTRVILSLCGFPNLDVVSPVTCKLSRRASNKGSTEGNSGTGYKATGDEKRHPTEVKLPPTEPSDGAGITFLSFAHRECGWACRLSKPP